MFNCKNFKGMLDPNNKRIEQKNKIKDVVILISNTLLDLIKQVDHKSI